LYSYKLNIMVLSPCRSVLLETNPDSDKGPPVPSKSVLNLTDEVVPSSRGIGLHTRYTRRNQIQDTAFRELVHSEVLENLHILLNTDVMTLIELYTFERTHSVVPYHRTEYRRSLSRDEDILDLLTPCEQYGNRRNCDHDYILHTLIGRVLYGFDIHDSRYGTIDDPNPCEIMTNEGGLYLVPDQMSDWFLYKDGECVALPVLHRFKHYITDAKIIARSSGPFLRLMLKPVQCFIPGKESPPQSTKWGSHINYEDSDLESFPSTDIDPNLLSNTKSISEDSFSVEIANSWNSKRESLLVVLSPLPPEMEHINESCDPSQTTFSADLTDDIDSVIPQEDAKIADFENEYSEESENEDDNNSDNWSSYNEPNSEFPLGKPEHENASENFVISSTTTGRSSLTSLGSGDFPSGAGDDHSYLEKDDIHFASMSLRPSLTPDIDSQATIILELGAGVIGIPDLSVSYLHYLTTPNPYCNCSDFRDSSLEIMVL